jgi:3,4-dihydroxy-2-butanone 4-phosphate synthase
LTGFGYTVAYLGLRATLRRAEICPEPIQSALAQLQGGGAIVLIDPTEREGEGDLAFAACHCTLDLVNSCLRLARGTLCVALAEEHASRLNLKRLPSNGLDPFETPFATPVDLQTGSSGVSARARCATIRALSEANRTASDFSFPGHVHTPIGHTEGLRGRRGHTEAILTLLQLGGIPGPGVLCEILNDSGDIATRPELETLGQEHDLPILEINTLVAFAGTRESGT